MNNTETNTVVTLELTEREAVVIKRALSVAERTTISNARRAGASKRSGYAMEAAEYVHAHRKVEAAEAAGR